MQFGGLGRTRTCDQSVMSRPHSLKLLNKLSVSELAELSNFSKSYISQVKHGKRPLSIKLINALVKLDRHNNLPDYNDALQQFLRSRREGISPNTLRDYRITLYKALSALGLKPSTRAINHFLGSLPCSLGGKYGYYKDLRVFFNWLYSPMSGLDFNPEDNPITWVTAPKKPQPILPSLTKEQVESLFYATPSLKDKAIIALFTESGLRLSELTNVRLRHIDWANRTVKTLGKGNKEGYAPFGSASERYLRAWLDEFQPNRGNIWGLNKWGIVSMLNRLQEKTGLPCNPHTFRRTFACLLRKQGVDSLTIKDLGRWESLEMVQRYTRSVSFEDSLRFYRAPLS